MPNDEVRFKIITAREKHFECRNPTYSRRRGRIKPSTKHPLVFFTLTEEANFP